MTVSADDYGRDRIAGTLVFANAHEIAIRREAPEVGEVVVHFPRAGFSGDGGGLSPRLAVEAADGVDDLLLVGFRQVGVHRQGHDAVADVFGDGQAAGRFRIDRIDVLHVDRDRIVDRGRHALGFQVGDEAVAVVVLDRVLRPVGEAARR